MYHIVILANSISTTIRFRGSLIELLASEGHKVTVVAPLETNQNGSDLLNLGAEFVPLSLFGRQSKDPLSELRLLGELVRVFGQLKPDRLYCCGLKAVIWGAFAASRVEIERTVGLIEGMGTLYSLKKRSAWRKLVNSTEKKMIQFLLRCAVKNVSALIVLNKHDHSLLIREIGCDEDQLHLMDGIGVDLNEFPACQPLVKPIRFTLAARMVEEKGVEQFIFAASKIRASQPGVMFRILGGIDRDANSVSEKLLRQSSENKIVEWKGFVKNVRADLEETSVFVLPTLYSEGLPRSIMEAMAMGRPIITTDMPGASDAVTENKSGYIIPAGDTGALVEACLAFVDCPNQIASMGYSARREASRRYCVRDKNEQQRNHLIG